MMQFAYDTAMLRDKLYELNGASQVEIVQKVPHATLAVRKREFDVCATAPRVARYGGLQRGGQHGQ